jgi:hypothetical protein
MGINMINNPWSFLLHVLKSTSKKLIINKFENEQKNPH